MSEPKPKSPLDVSLHDLYTNYFGLTNGEILQPAGYFNTIYELSLAYAHILNECISNYQGNDVNINKLKPYHETIKQIFVKLKDVAWKDDLVKKLKELSFDGSSLSLCFSTINDNILKLVEGHCETLIADEAQAHPDNMIPVEKAKVIEGIRSEISKIKNMIHRSKTANHIVSIVRITRKLDNIISRKLGKPFYSKILFPVRWIGKKIVNFVHPVSLIPPFTPEKLKDVATIKAKLDKNEVDGVDFGKYLEYKYLMDSVPSNPKVLYYVVPFGILATFFAMYYVYASRQTKEPEDDLPPESSIPVGSIDHSSIIIPTQPLKAIETTLQSAHPGSSSSDSSSFLLHSVVASCAAFTVVSLLSF